MIAFLEASAMQPLINACLEKLEEGGPVSYLDFPPDLGMTEVLFEVLMEEIALHLMTGHTAVIH